jgi:hypothetical protein
MSSRSIYKRARRVRVALGTILTIGILLILFIAYSYSPS